MPITRMGLIEENERFVDTEEGVVLIEDGARGLRPATHFEIELRAKLLTALDQTKAYEKALREIDEVAPDNLDEAFDCGRHDEPDHDHEFYWKLWDNASQVGMQKIAKIARGALAASGSEGK